jgi:hypothetical protein
MLIFMVALAGCAGSPEVRYADRSVTADEVQESVRLNYAQLRTLVGSGNISVETPELSQNGSFTLNLRKPDSLLVKFEGPFGIDVGGVLLTRQDFRFYNSLQNRLITGSTTSDNLRKALKLDVGFDDMMNLFTGGLFFSEDRRDPDEFMIESETFVLAFTHKGGVRRYLVDPATMLIGRIQHMDSGGRLLVEQRFSDFTAYGGMMIPRRVRITQSRERRAVSISYSDLQVNTPSLDFKLNVPSNAERIQW